MWQILKLPTINRNPIKDIFNQANSFYQAGSRCIADLKVNPETTISLMTPAIVSWAFALELYFKTLLKIQGLDTKGHLLDDLYQKLDEKHKSELKTLAVAERIDLEKEIKLVNNAFIDWRYQHEKNELIHLNCGNLDKLCTILHKYIVGICPEIKSLFEKATELIRQGY